MNPGYDHKDCGMSTGIHDGPTFGKGKLDHNGYWEYPCYECARRHEKEYPEDGECWPWNKEPVNFDALRELNIERCEAKDGFKHNLLSWSPTDWGCAMGGECGEALNLIKKLRRGEEIDPVQIGKEIADVVIYADLLAARLGLRLGDLVRMKFNQKSRDIGWKGGVL